MTISICLRLMFLFFYPTVSRFRHIISSGITVDFLAFFRVSFKSHCDDLTAYLIMKSIREAFTEVLHHFVSNFLAVQDIDI